MDSYVLGFKDIDKTNLMLVGGKGANLGELFKIPEVRVPDGFCISTKAFKRTIGATPSINELLNQLSTLSLDDRNKILELTSEIRRTIEGLSIPEDIEEEINLHLSRLGEHHAYAVRSSATAEDLPTASFAGQQDTYLNIIGKDAILKHISKCWASLFTERAVTYRIQNGFDHRKVFLSVVIQKMIFPEAAGIMFTADPVTSNRKVLSIDASFGLGEALVSGLVNADNYKVRNKTLLEKKISTKKLAIYALNDGGTKEEELEAKQQNRQVLTDSQILQLETIGRKLEEHFGCPQDIEWCLRDDIFFIVQSRPITTLYPVPQTNDGENHVFVSVGHQQMMTDPMKPLGMSIFELTSFGSRFSGGGRLFVDVAQNLASSKTRKGLIESFGQADPLIKDALVTIIERGDFIKMLPDEEEEQGSSISNKHISPVIPPAEIDPEVVYELMESRQSSIEELRNKIQTTSGPDVFDLLLEDIQKLKNSLFEPKSMNVIIAAMGASSWINEKIYEWLGEQNVADILSQSVPNNITSEMGLELLDVADALRPYPEVIEYLQKVKDDNFLDELVNLDGGHKAQAAINSYLDKYGMRCSGEIDITKPRWREKPTTLIPMILGNIRNFEPQASSRRFERGQQEALKKEQELLERLRHLPEGDEKARETKEKIDLLRNLSGYREYPKYSIVNHYFVYKQALLKEAEKLVQSSVIKEKEDIFYLTFEELHKTVCTNEVDLQIINQRKEEYNFYKKLTPPRVITSDGEIITGMYQRENLPPDAIIGLPVSSGVVEGRARVILSMDEANLEEGDILVTAFTDPSWTPLFVTIKGLITEVGGLMTHGAVIAREYGLPALVGVEDATKLIKDGQRIRLNGTQGYINILNDSGEKPNDARV